MKYGDGEARGDRQDFPTTTGGLVPTELGARLASEAPPESSTSSRGIEDGPKNWVVCLWCKPNSKTRIIEEGDPGAPTSHDCCDRCEPRVMAEAARDLGFRIIRPVTLDFRRAGQSRGEPHGPPEECVGEVCILPPRQAQDIGTRKEFAIALANEETPNFLRITDWDTRDDGVFVHVRPTAWEEVMVG